MEVYLFQVFHYLIDIILLAALCFPLDLFYLASYEFDFIMLSREG